jgi:pimeloyl-ACP methyl ester carboxylesterase
MVDGRQVHYLEWGQAGYPAILCLHGGGQTAYMFEDLGAALAGRYYVLAYDLPDHGDSDPLTDEVSLDRHVLAATVPRMCAEFGVERTVLVGASLGGMMAITVAAARPEMVAGIVLVDVGHRLESDGIRRITNFMCQAESFADLDEAAMAIAAYLPNRVPDPKNLTRNLRQRADGRWIWKHGLGRHIRRMGELDLDQARGFVTGVDDDLRGLRCPLWVLRGSDSDVLSEDGASQVIDLVPHARLERIVGAGHLAAGDNPRSFMALVKSFLDAVDWSGGRWLTG